MNIKNLLLLLCVFALISACKDEQADDPLPAPLTYDIPDDLLGSWTADKPAHVDMVPLEYLRRVFVKSNTENGTYEFYWIGNMPGFGWVVVAAEKGNFTVNPSKIFMTPTEFGSEQITPGVMEFYDTTHWYFPGDPMFDMFDYLPEYEFEIQTDTLIWRGDGNADGDYLDEGEVIKYIRENK